MIKGDETAQLSARKKNSRKIRVLVVAPDLVTSELLLSTLASKRGFAAAAIHGDSAQIIRNLNAHKPDVTLISEELPDGPRAGLRVLQRLCDAPECRCVLLVKNPERDCIVGAFREGARGIFCRTQPLEDLPACIRGVHEGQIWASLKSLGYVLDALRRVHRFQPDDAGGIQRLTAREKEVVHLVAEGLKNREIAARLNVADHSIRNYLYRIFNKVGVSSRGELILYALNQRERAN